ncbi:hypothetical protein HMPREF9333_01812 [Johnsonella ignava ATCC 51276]|uniref:NAD(+) diphosphatase n=1 Tax=Johnsonella ignava ATCC 51276 TaxID=679200 RepID=G5GJS2_9FIRM|nr:NAD(+) diphosphatase [Johnsonella ignava]EHI54965.1 hypothetical protein HMPREF9333_01812 [Johnsonella ignava ATCC 51276]
MFHEIYPKIFDPEYLNKQPLPDSYLLFFDKSYVFLQKTDAEYHSENACTDLPENGLSIPKFKYFGENIDRLTQNSYYLFSIDDDDYFLALNFDSDKGDSLQLTGEKIDIFRKLSPKSTAFAVLVGYHIYTWLQNRKYCGRCGSVNLRSDTERALICPRCSQIEYPRIIPAVIVAITDKDNILLTKRANSSYKLPALVSGFLEIGETLEENVKREVFEEVGIRVKNVKYYGSQPWGIAEAVMIAFTAELDGDNKITIEENELSEAAWVKRQDVPILNSDISIGQEMIQKFREGKL